MSDQGGGQREVSPTRAPKKHTAFNIWRIKKKHQHPANYGVFVPHPPPPVVSEEPGTPAPSVLEPAVEDHEASQETSEYTRHSRELQPYEISPESSSLTEIGILKKSRAQPPEENKRKPVLGKLGNLFTAGRRRNTRNGSEGSTNSVPKLVSPSKLSEKEKEKSKSGIQSKNPDGSVESSSTGKTHEPENDHAEDQGQTNSLDAELSSCLSNSETVAVQLCDESDSSKLEPSEQERDTFPDPTATAKDLPPNPEYSSRQENSEILTSSLEKLSGSSHSSEEDKRCLTNGSPEDSNSHPPENSFILTSLPKELGGNCLSNLQIEGRDNKPEFSHAISKAVPCASDSKTNERAHPAKVLTLDIYLRKTEEVSPVDEPVVVSLAEEDCSDSEEMEKRSNGRRSGRRRKSQKSTDALNGDKVPVETVTSEDSVFAEDASPAAVAEKVSGEKKVKSPQAGTATAAAAAAALPERSALGSGHADSKAGTAHLKGHSKGDSDKGRQPQLPSTSPTKRKGRSRLPEATPLSPPGGSKNQGKDSPPKKQSGAAPDGNSASTSKAPAAGEKAAPAAGEKAAAAAGPGNENGEEGAVAAKVIPRELPVKSSTLLPEIRPEHKRSSFLNHLDGKAEGGRNRGELTRLPASSDPDNCKHRNHLGAARATVTTKINLPAKPKHVELNFKAPKNLEGLGNDHNPCNQPVHKGNTANKISLFENKRASNSPRHTDNRGVKSVPSKTFVGRAKLNLGKKVKESEQPEKKGNMQNNHPNGGLLKEASTEKIIPPENDILPATTNHGETVDCQLGHTEKADVQRDPACPLEQTGAAQIPTKDPEILGENNLETVNSTALVLENKVDLDRDNKDSAQTVPLKPDADVLNLHPTVEISHGPSNQQLASVSMATNGNTSVSCDGDASLANSNSSTDVKEQSQPSSASIGRTKCDLPVSCENENKMTATELGDKIAVSAEQDLLNTETKSPSKVLVQVRSFMLPVETAQGRAPHIILGSSEVEEVRLTSYYNDENEGESSHSCTYVKNEGPDTKTTSPKDVECGGEHIEKSGLQSEPLELEKTMSIPTPSNDSKVVRGTESSPISSPRSKGTLELLPNQVFKDAESSPASVMNVSVGSDDNSFDSSSDMEKFTEIIKKMDSSICVPQKKKKARVPNSPAPHFAMPPIHEDNLEKVLDPSVFTFGLGKNKENQQDMSPGMHLLQGLDLKSKLRPKRTSAEQSILFKSGNTPSKNEFVECSDTNGKENRDVINSGIKRSRLEKSALFSSMLSSSPVPKEKVFSPSVTSVNTMTTSFGTSQNSSLLPKSGSDGISDLSTQPSVSENELHKPPSAKSSKIFNFDSSSKSLSGSRSPNYVEKYLQTVETKRDPDSRSNVTLPETRLSELSKNKNNNGVEKSNSFENALKSQMPNYGSTDTDFMSYLKSSIYEPNISLAGMSLSDNLVFNRSMQNKINPRPGKVVIYSEPTICGNCFEVFSDIPDCTSWSLSPVIIVKVVRGCWILYEKPNFEGNSVPLEEGELELCDPWGVEDISPESEEKESAKPLVIGSIRHVIKDYRISQIDLFTEPEGLGVVSSYFDDTEEMQMYGAMQKTCSMKVHWGTWLIYEEPGFQGIPFVLEPGEYPDLSFWDTEEAYIGSMRPLKMGGRKVEFPSDPKVIIYEKPFFEGKCMELETEMCDFIIEGDETEEVGEDNLPLKSIGSIKVLGGIWVAFEKPGFTGHQYLLEEGEYKEWQDWGGYDGELKSLRPILGDFSNAHMIMYSEKNFGTKGSNIDVLGIVANLKDTGYGVKTQSINVLSGVWVAYENPDFTGEQYILDKGFYTSFEDWGGKNCKISSVQPICLDTFTSPRERNKVHLFSEPEFRGSNKVFGETTKQIEDSFSAKSCRVLGGSWVAYDGENFSGNQYVLEEGHYPSLSAMGCPPETNFKSLRYIDVEFSEPVIVLFEREDFKGKKIELNEEIVNLRFLGFNTQIRSVQVIGGIWVTYEYSNYRGRQILLSPAEVSNWYEFSGCRQIGSLRPFIQKRIYFRLRNKATGLFMSTNGNLEDLKLLRIQVMEDVGADDQIWIYQEGCIKCRIAEDCCLTIVGSLVTSGSKLGLALDQNEDSQFWSIKSDGRIYSKLKPNLVLDIKGGTQYDQKHVILNTAHQEKSTQVWEALIL